jgi:methylmalonyl-CoA mutase
MSASSSVPDAMAGEAAWRSAVDRVLKGAAFDAVMVAATDDHIAIQPLYPKADPLAAQPRRRPGRIGVVQPIDHPDPGEAGRLALGDVEGGADGLAIVLAGAGSARGFGLPAGQLDHDALLGGVDRGAVALRLEAAPADAVAAAEVLAAWAEASPAGTGGPIDFGLGAADAAVALALRRRGFAAPVLRADGRPYQQAGATEAQELASMLAEGAAMLRGLETAGATDADLGDLVSLVAVADTDLLLTVAKLRALRRLWACLEDACGLPPRPLHLHVETAWRAMTRRDPWTNLLRAGIGGAGAILGGADSLTVIPFTAPLGLPDAFARRLARNTGHVLRDEAHLGQLADPAGGSGAFEALTDALCDKAWGLFQDIEDAGGFPAARRSGFWAAALADSRARRRQDVAAGRRPILGTSVFPPGDVTLPPVLMAARRTVADQGDLPSVRDAESLEGPDAGDAEEGRP